MRDLLNDLEKTRPDADDSPMRRAQANMRTALPRRFYEKAAAVPDVEGHVVHLDGRPVRTPAKAVLTLPTAAAATLVAGEYDAQVDVIDPMTMPVTRLANTAVDGVAADPQAVLEDILRYASTDMLCYRAAAPQELGARQAEIWDPVLDWARAELGARFVLAEGVMHVEQPREAIGAVGIHLSMHKEPMRLAALHVMTSLTGSALLALALDRGAIEPDEAWRAAHVDEDWNIEQWGEDAEAAAMRESKRRDLMGAVALVRALESR